MNPAFEGGLHNAPTYEAPPPPANGYVQQESQWYSPMHGVHGDHLPGLASAPSFSPMWGMGIPQYHHPGVPPTFAQAAAATTPSSFAAAALSSSTFYGGQGLWHSPQILAPNLTTSEQFGFGGSGVQVPLQRSQVVPHLDEPLQMEGEIESNQILNQVPLPEEPQPQHETAPEIFMGNAVPGRLSPSPVVPLDGSVEGMTSAIESLNVLDDTPLTASVVVPPESEPVNTTPVASPPSPPIQQPPAVVENSEEGKKKKKKKKPEGTASMSSAPKSYAETLKLPGAAIPNKKPQQQNGTTTTTTTPTLSFSAALTSGSFPPPGSKPQQTPARGLPRANHPKLGQRVDSMPGITDQGKKSFNISPSFGRFFVIKSYTEDDVHKCIKYSVWASTDTGNRRLDSAFMDAQGKGPVYLFFSVNGSGQFCGMAQMLSRVDYDRKFGAWEQDKWSGQFSVEWLFIKDIPNKVFRHITLPNNEDKPVTNSRDTQEIPMKQAREVLKLFAKVPHKSSIMDDFAFYDDREKQRKAAEKSTKNDKAPRARPQN